MKKEIAKILGAFLVFSFVPNYAEAQFSDIAGSPYQTAIENLAEKGVLEGYTDGTYRPDQKINRAEFAKIIVASHPLLKQTETSDCAQNYTLPSWSYVYFPDVARDAWYTPYVCMAKIKGVVKGYTDGTYKPAQNISYAEALKIIYASYEDTGDKSATEQWYAPYIDDAKKNNIGLDLKPEKEITRGEMAQIIENFLNKKEIKNPVADINPADFFLYKNSKWGFQIMLPSAIKDYKIAYVDEPWTNCNNELYTLLETIPARQYELGYKSYEELGKFMPFNIGRIEDAKMCTAGMLSLFNRDSWCEKDPTLCQTYRNLKFIQKDGYLLEFVPLYWEGADDKNYLYIPKAGELEYMRESFEIIQ